MGRLLSRGGLLPIGLLSLLILPWPVLASGAAQNTLAPATSEREPTPELQQHIRQLIEQLGAPKYRDRERAENELRALGLIAMEALLDSGTHEDMEIRLRARQIATHLRSQFIHESVPLELRPLMADYDRQSVTVREQRLLRLAPLAQDLALGTLARLARFEESELLAKEAALIILETDLAADGRLEERSRVLQASLGFSQRRPADWIRSFVRSYEEPDAAINEFDAWLTQEQQLLSSGLPQTSRSLVDRLARSRIDLLLRSDRREEAVQGMRALALGDELNPVSTLLAIDWLLEREAWPVVEELAERHGDRFQQDALLLYRLAESRLALGRDAEAQEAADKAFGTAGAGIEAYVGLYPGVVGLDIVRQIGRQPMETAARRFALARLLDDERGRSSWAEREYRAVTATDETLTTENGLLAQYYLAEMLHDQQREQDAAEALQTLVDGAQESDETKRAVEGSLHRIPDEIRARMHYFYACAAAQQSDVDGQMQQLQQGLAADPQDVDVLIAMHRLTDAPEDWRRQARQGIEQTLAAMLQEIQDLRQRYRATDSELERNIQGYTLATKENQYAWLVANTLGDIDEALRASHHSLELRPGEAGYLDTLARCYFRKGDLESAIKYQRQAVQLSPHEGQIRRQLELFESSLQAAPEADS